MKWYEKLLVAVLVILCSPLIIFCLILVGVIYPFVIANEWRIYRKSAYYNDFKIPFRKRKSHKDGYTFYNYAVSEKLPIQYHFDEKTSLEYFLYQNTIYVFPKLCEIIYHEDNNSWEVKNKNHHKIVNVSLEEYFDKIANMLKNDAKLPVKLFISRNYILNRYIDLSNLPESLYLVRNYTSMFQEQDMDLLSYRPNNTKDLYEMMLKNKKLGGSFELVGDDLILWTFDQFYYEISISEDDGYFVVNKTKRRQITHWHPSEAEIYDEICNVGEKGNVLVIRSFFGIESVLYMGPMEKCKIRKKGVHLGKLYFLESK